MNTKKSDLAAAILFCGFLTVMLVCYLLLPKQTFSANEKRYLADPPKAGWQEITSGSWGSAAETYMADHMPGRDFFVGLNAYFDLAAGRFNAEDVRLVNSRILEAPNVLREASLKKNLAAIQSFSETVEQPVHLMLVPSAGWAMGAADYTDDTIIGEIYARSRTFTEPVDLRPVFQGKPELFYRTDHHWTSEGAFAGYSAWMEALGREPRREYRVEAFGGFQGSTYSRSALWLTEGEEIQLWHGADSITVVNNEAKTAHDGLFYPERLEEADKYTVFLDGNHSLVRITNPEGRGRILVIRDSYSNSLGCFLAQSYGEVVLTDLRYYKSPISRLAAEEAFDDILICYSIGNFLTDTNIVMLR